LLIPPRQEGRGEAIGELPKVRGKIGVLGKLLDAASLSEGIIQVIDQPWGINISEMTVRASGELWLL